MNALTVCVNFGDYLRTTLPINSQYFKNFVIVTEASDRETCQVCAEFGVPTVLTTAHRCDGGFNKGAAINVGLLALDEFSLDWTVHLDADVIITPELAALAVDTTKSRGTIYGCHRRMCNSYEDFNKFQRTGQVQHMLQRKRGPNVLPVGYFQLWHRLSWPTTWYDEDTPTAGHTDFMFSKKFISRVFLDADVVHLSTGQWRQGLDHKGRVSKRWEYSRDSNGS